MYGYEKLINKYVGSFHATRKNIKQRYESSKFVFSKPKPRREKFPSTFSIRFHVQSHVYFVGSRNYADSYILRNATSCIVCYNLLSVNLWQGSVNIFPYSFYH